MQKPMVNKIANFKWSLGPTTDSNDSPHSLHPIATLLGEKVLGISETGEFLQSDFAGVGCHAQTWLEGVAQLLLVLLIDGGAHLGAQASEEKRCPAGDPIMRETINETVFLVIYGEKIFLTRNWSKLQLSGWRNSWGRGTGTSKTRARVSLLRSSNPL